MTTIFGIFQVYVTYIIEVLFKPSPIKLIKTKTLLLGPFTRMCLYFP